jgi:hypothetical protein
VTQADTHCTVNGVKKAQPVSAASCSVTAEADAGAPEEGGGDGYGETLAGAEGDDDDCKYRVAWSSTPVRRNTDVTFNVTIHELAGGAAADGAEPEIEAFLGDTHPAPNTGAKTTEAGAGAYAIGPIRFDAAGRWTVRFHIHEQCTDVAEDSPHGHVAFYVDVP